MPTQRGITGCKSTTKRSNSVKILLLKYHHENSDVAPCFSIIMMHHFAPTCHSLILLSLHTYKKIKLLQLNP